jgi:hypothetical protein
LLSWGYWVRGGPKLTFCGTTPASRTKILPLACNTRADARAGASGTQAQIIEHLLSPYNSTRMHAHGFALWQLAPSVILLTYKSAYFSSSGSLERYANRSSIWRLEALGWQMVFHQGTPAEPFSNDAV